MADTPFDPAGASDADRPGDEPALARDEPTLARDEAISAYLDGEATPAEIAQVESSPELMARVDVFSSLQAPLQAVPTPDLDAKNAAIAAAVAAAVTVDPTDVATAAAAVVASRSATKRAPWYQRLAPGLVMACVLVAGLIAAPFILGGGSDDADIATETATNAFEAESQKTPAAAADTGAPAEASDDAGLTAETAQPESAEGADEPPDGVLLMLPPADAFLAGYTSPEALADAVLGDLDRFNAQATDAAPSISDAPATEAPATTAVTSDLGTTARSGGTLLQFEERSAGDIDIGDGTIYSSLILPNRDVFVLVDGPDAAVLVIDAGNCAVLHSA